MHIDTYSYIQSIQLLASQGHTRQAYLLERDLPTLDQTKLRTETTLAQNIYH